MANEIGNVKGTTGTSMGLNGQKGCGGQMPSMSGNASPGGTKPPKEMDGKVPKSC